MVENPGGVGDPFAALGVARGALPPPAEAHQDQVLVLDYKDDLGIPNTFNGPESAFDWTDVSEVVTKTLDGRSVDGATPAAAPPALPMSDQALVDSVLAADSSTAKTLMLAALPVSDSVLSKVLTARVMNSSDAKNVLIDASPLSGSILSLVFDGSAGLNGSDVVNVRDAQ